MINIQNKIDCCGCNSCGDICVHGAITFKTDNEGFWYPDIDESKCVNCRLCEKVCPIIHADDLKKNDYETPICYAAENKNLEVVFDSTSGGLFSALADRMYRDKGYVGGAIFNDDFSVREYISNEKQDLPKLRSSKYLQSNAEGFYRQIKNLLKQGEKVLVCGTPCQMAALRAYIGNDNDNLIIIDFICRGVNSPKIWRKYLDSFEERYGSKVVYAKAKSKEYGWRNLTQKVILENGRAIYENRYVNAYSIGYLSTNAYCRPSCYECQFKGFPRVADITIADFWGVENVNDSLDKDLGTSLVMINSKKGEFYFEKIKPRINFVEVPFESVLAGNPMLMASLDAPKVDRNLFFEDVERMTFTQLTDKYINASNSSKIIRRRRIKNVFRALKKRYQYIRMIWRETGSSITAICQFFKYNTWNDIRQKNIVIPRPNVVIEVHEGGKILRQGISVIGWKKIEKSKLETRIFVGKNAILEFQGGNIIGYGSCIEVHDNAKIIFREGSSCNTSSTFVAQELIEIGKDAKLGRHITIRDNNGNHYMNRDGYRNTRPVLVGDKAWLTESCTLMPGAKIGQGAIIGANAVVFSHIKSFAMAIGNPAQVIDENVLWKY